VHETIDVIRRVLLAILLIGLVGTATELLLLKHDEDPAQFIPLVLIGVAFIALAWHALDEQRTSLRVVQATMVLFVVAGVLGMYFHYRANVAFQLEVDPAVGGRALLVKALMAKTPPALAPGSMSQLGLIGLAYAYRYPIRRGRGHITRAATRPSSSGGDA
jgi:peptidoglycan biosynthesis protein MviN/MurJ (putative lipid II flippase)